MKSFSNMSHGDLIIIRDALKEVIARQHEIKLWVPATTAMNHAEFKSFIDEMVNHLHHKTYNIERIGELLIAIDDALHQDDSE